VTHVRMHRGSPSTWRLQGAPQACVLAAQRCSSSSWLLGCATCEVRHVGHWICHYLATSAKAAVFWAKHTGLTALMRYIIATKKWLENDPLFGKSPVHMSSVMAGSGLIVSRGIWILNCRHTAYHRPAQTHHVDSQIRMREGICDLCDSHEHRHAVWHSSTTDCKCRMLLHKVQLHSWAL